MKSIKRNQLFWITVLLALLFSATGTVTGTARALPLPAPPPVDMFQWPWEQGLSWVSFDAFDNGTKRLPTSPHNYQMGGAIDFAPHNNMVNGEDTSNFWVTAAAAGTITVKSSCYVILDHGNGWTTEYWHLANIQVNIGAVVSRNQRLGVIANNANQVTCTGQEAPVPHLHFVMRPKMIETIFSGWKINFNVKTNITTFTKNGQTVGRGQPILNVPISGGTPVATNTPTPTGSQVFTSTPTLTASPVGTNTSVGTSTPVFTNTPTLTGTSIFTSTPAFTNTPNLTTSPVATNTPIPTGGTPVSTNTLVSGTPASSQTPAFTNTPTFTPPPMTPTISPTTCNQAELTGYVNIPPGTLMSPGATFTQSWGLRNIGWCTWTTAYHLVFYSGDQMGAPLSVNIASYDVAPGQLIIVSVPFTAPISNGHFTSLWKLSDASSIQFGVGASANDPLILDINVSNPNTTPASPTPTIPPVPSSTSVPSITPTATIITGPYVITSANPLTLVVGATGLVTVSLNNIPVEGYTSTEFTCTYNQNLVSVSNVAIAGLFGADPVSGILGPQNGSFIVAIAGSSGNKAMGSGTAFTFKVNGSQIGQTTIECTARVSKGLGILENILSIPTSLTVVGFVTPSAVPTAVPTSATLTGQVLASKLVTLTLYNPDNSIAATTTSNPDGTFSIIAPGGTYTIVATASGFLSAQGSITLVNGNASSKPIISLIAGDIDGNSIINQLDSLTIGMNYNNTTPTAADLNNDGIINVLDLGILAENYGASGALAW